MCHCFFRLLACENQTHQLAEHRHGIIGELLAELNNLRHDQGAPATGVEVIGQPGRRGVAVTNHLVPPSRGNTQLQTRVDLKRPQECNPFNQPDQVLSRGQTDVRASFHLNVSGKASLVPTQVGEAACLEALRALSLRQKSSRNPLGKDLPMQ